LLVLRLFDLCQRSSLSPTMNCSAAATMR
jgi:hypothetical protein